MKMKNLVILIVLRMLVTGNFFSIFNYMINIYDYGALTAIGLIAGFLLDLVGGGADVVIVPLLLFFHIFKKLRTAVGTSVLMLLPPITGFAAWKYWKKGDLNIPYAVYLAIIYSLSSLFFSRFAFNLNPNYTRKIESIFIIIIGIITWFFKV